MLSEIDLDNLSIISYVKKGEVFDILHIKYKDNEYLLKKLNQNYDDANYMFNNELVSLRTFDNQFIIKIVDFSIQKYYALLLEYVKGRTLRDIVQNDFNSLDGTKKQIICICILDALTSIHEKKYCLMDLNPDSIFITDDFIPKLVDFSQCVYELSPIMQYGILEWLAPELIEFDSVASSLCDIYSFGMLMSYLYTGIYPFSGMNEAKIIYKKVNKTKPSLPSVNETNKKLIFLIEQCMQYNLEYRPKAGQVLAKMASCETVFPGTDVEAVSEFVKKYSITIPSMNFKFTKLVETKKIVNEPHPGLLEGFDNIPLFKKGLVILPTLKDINYLKTFVSLLVPIFTEWNHVLLKDIIDSVSALLIIHHELYPTCFECNIHDLIQFRDGPELVSALKLIIQFINFDDSRCSNVIKKQLGNLININLKYTLKIFSVISNIGIYNTNCCRELQYFCIETMLEHRDVFLENYLLSYLLILYSYYNFSEDHEYNEEIVKIAQEVITTCEDNESLLHTLNFLACNQISINISHEKVLHFAQIPDLSKGLYYYILELSYDLIDEPFLLILIDNSKTDKNASALLLHYSDQESHANIIMKHVTEWSKFLLPTSSMTAMLVVSLLRYKECREVLSNDLESCVNIFMNILTLEEAFYIPDIFRILKITSAEFVYRLNSRNFFSDYIDIITLYPANFLVKGIFFLEKLININPDIDISKALFITDKLLSLDQHQKWINYIITILIMIGSTKPGLLAIGHLYGKELATITNIAREVDDPQTNFLISVLSGILN